MHTGEKVISEELRRRFAVAERVLVLTGAGVSAESGVPTFRGGGGTDVWKGLPSGIVESGEIFERNLTQVWAALDDARRMIEKLQPNAAHFALARWQEHFPEFTLVTQNIDGLHQAAGSRNVIELHGSLRRARCLSCAAKWNLSELRTDEPPSCLECGGHLRPDVILFGEIIPMGAFELAKAAARNSDLTLVVGTSAVVYPAAALPEIARDAGAYTVEINPERTPLSKLCDEVIQGKAGEILPLF